MSYPTFLSAVERQVRDELDRIHEKWGEQNHPDGTGLHYLKAEADEARRTCDYAFEHKRGTWRHILAEEVAEAFAEKDPAKLRAELIQVAAVAQQWVAAIDRRAAQTTEERK